MKRPVLLIVSLIMLLCLASCSGDENEPENKEPVNDNTPTTHTCEDKDEDGFCDVCGIKSDTGVDLPEIHLHTMNKTEKKDETCTHDGNIEYYCCVSCGKLYSDSQGKNEITFESTKIKASHKMENGKCTVCGFEQ